MASEYHGALLNPGAAQAKRMNSGERIVPLTRHVRMPPEWGPHAATWLSWPHNRDTWPDCFDAVEPAMREVVAALAESELVRVNVLDEEHERHVRKVLAAAAPPERIELHRIATNDAWIRDHGAIFVRDIVDESLLALGFGYNAWGGKYPPYELDQAVAGQMAAVLGVPSVRPGIVLEGGSIDVNGTGALLTTTQCLLNPNRNPSLRRAELESVLQRTLGVDQVIWLGEGIVGDDTDGHVDDITRFVAHDRIVTAVEPDCSDPNHAPLAANRRLLEGLRLAGGIRPEILELPMPDPVWHRDGRLPASYANFYVANTVVLVPTFRGARDAEACAILAACFPNRRIVPIDCRALVAGLGAIHCLTQQVPAA
jgi:agmatine deiminase